jgi:hypothetical protein
MGLVRNPDGTGSANRFLPNNPVVEMPDGTHQILFRDSNDATRLISPSHWVYQQAQAGVWTLTLTDGTTYTFQFDHLAGYVTPDGVQVAQATRITHANGAATIHMYYLKVNGYSYLDRIQDSTGRQARFLYDYSQHQLTSISVAGITYTYAYQTVATPSEPLNLLATVTPPVGNSWRYTYHPTTSELAQLTYPYNGTIAYEYEDVWFDTGATKVKFHVVTRRTTGSRAIPRGTWTYQYRSGGTAGDVTTVTAPNGITEVYTHYGWGNSGPGNVWRIGLPISTRIYHNTAMLYAEQRT